MRGIDQLALIFAQINGIFFRSAEIAAPPCAVIIFCHGGVVDSRSSPVIALFGVDFRTLYHDQQFRILFQYPCRTGFCGVFPVGRVGGIVPLCHLVFYISCAVGFVFQVNGKNGVVVFIVVCEPCQCIAPVLCAEFVRIPQADLMTGGSVSAL